MAEAGNAGQKFKHADHVSWRRVGEEIVVLDLNTSAYFSLNETGSLIWERLGNGEAVPSIAEAICEEYDVEESRALKDVESTIQDMVKNKILEPRAA